MTFSLTNNKLIDYLKGVRDELQKVVWPTKKDVYRHTLIVIGVTIFTAIYLGVLDLLFNWGLENVI